MRWTSLGWVASVVALPVVANGLDTYTVGAGPASGVYVATGSVAAVGQGGVGR